LPFNFLAFSFASDSMVFATDNLASGNNTFDNDSNILYVSFVSETFLYLLMSVMRVSFHINNPYIDDSIGLSMKILMSLIICSSIAGECMPPFQWPEAFNTKYDCLHFGYEEAQRKLEEIGREDINKYGMYIKFTCTPIETI
jgi:hypothetical protein